MRLSSNILYHCNYGQRCKEKPSHNFPKGVFVNVTHLTTNTLSRVWPLRRERTRELQAQRSELELEPTSSALEGYSQTTGSSRLFTYDFSCSFYVPTIGTYYSCVGLSTAFNIGNCGTGTPRENPTLPSILRKAFYYGYSDIIPFRVASKKRARVAYK